MNRIIYTLVFVFFLTILNAQEKKASYGTYALVGATIHTVTNGIIKDGTLIIRDGIIDQIGFGIEIPSDCETIDCKGKHIYPGMMDSGCGMGLFELSSIALTRDRREIGDFKPHMRALTAVNPSSVHIAITRVSGVTSTLTVPQGGMFPGTADLINLYGYTPQQMYAGFSGVVMNFPSTGKWGRWDHRDDEKIKKDDEKKLKKFDSVWEKVKAYAKLDSANQLKGLAYNPEMEVLLGVLKGERSLIIMVNKEDEIKKAIEWVKENNISTAIFSGVREGWRVAQEIANSNIPCLVGPILSLPSRGYEPYDAAYKNASVLHKHGVLIAIKTTETENVRNLPFHAGFAAAYGLGTEAALEAVTINPAKIFGLDQYLGSLEKGKWANLFVTNGDPFEPKTQMKYLFIRGYNIPIDNRQIRLYDEFIERSPGVEMGN